MGGGRWERRGGGGRGWVGRGEGVGREGRRGEGVSREGGRGWEGRGVERYLHVNIEQSQWYVLSVKTT